MPFPGSFLCRKRIDGHEGLRLSRRRVAGILMCRMQSNAVVDADCVSAVELDRFRNFRTGREDVGSIVLQSQCWMHRILSPFRRVWAIEESILASRSRLADSGRILRKRKIVAKQTHAGGETCCRRLIDERERTSTRLRRNDQAQPVVFEDPFIGAVAVEIEAVVIRNSRRVEQDGNGQDAVVVARREPRWRREKDGQRAVELRVSAPPPS